LDIFNTEIVDQKGKDTLEKLAWLSFGGWEVVITASDSMVFHPADMLEHESNNDGELELVLPGLTVRRTMLKLRAAVHVSGSFTVGSTSQIVLLHTRDRTIDCQ